MIEQSAMHTRYQSDGCGGEDPNAWPNNIYGWGRIDAYAATCGGMPGAITDLSIEKLNTTDLQLTWAVRTHATAYNVLWSNAPYFAPVATCTAGSCASVTTPSATQTALGDASYNHTYLVQPRNRCGDVQHTPSNRVGEFEFELAR
jgi:hypothetical protein